MNHPSVDELRATAEEGARMSGRILAERFADERVVEHKGRIDLVTDGDKASEAALVSLLQKRYPTHAILAEEGGGTDREERRPFRWLVDPLDGTTNYAHRVPHFSVSVAVEGPEGLLAGAVFDPLRDEMFSAALGRGATLNGKSIRTTLVATLEQALLATGFPYDVRERPEPSLALFNRLVRQAQGIRRLGSAALDLCYVAAGRFDGYFERTLKPWDVAAGALIVLEAGGAVRDLNGGKFDMASGRVVVSGQPLIEVLSAECRECLEALGLAG